MFVVISEDIDKNSNLFHSVITMDKLTEDSHPYSEVECICTTEDTAIRIAAALNTVQSLPLTVTKHIRTCTK